MEILCRVCVEHSRTLVAIFPEKCDPVRHEERKDSLAYILSKCTNRRVKRGDCLPQYICLPCVLAAQNAFRFRSQCERSYQYFRHLPQTDQESESLKKEPIEQELSHPDQLSVQEHNAPLRENQSQNPNSNNKDVNPKARAPSKWRHQLSHFRKPAHKCPHCPKVYQRKDRLKQHLDTHDYEVFFCRQCFAVFTEGVQFDIHQREHQPKPGKEELLYEEHPDSYNSDKDKSLDGQDSGDEVMRLLRDWAIIQGHENSLESNASYIDGQSLWRIENVCHENTSASKEIQKKLVCNICRRSFKRNSNLTVHKRTHFPKCSYCKKGFSSKKQLTKHMRGHCGDLFRC
ncbi:hypothetical protein KR009_009227 [Drosophila setifemur]|nr:hypothetical protein KR009_009227 [Drosophila setifemur]